MALTTINPSVVVTVADSEGTSVTPSYIATGAKFTVGIASTAVAAVVEIKNLTGTSIANTNIASGTDVFFDVAITATGDNLPVSLSSVGMAFDNAAATLNITAYQLAATAASLTTTVEETTGLSSNVYTPTEAIKVGLGATTYLTGLYIRFKATITIPVS